jgi:hypothetical protein
VEVGFGVWMVIFIWWGLVHKPERSGDAD